MTFREFLRPSKEILWSSVRFGDLSIQIQIQIQIPVHSNLEVPRKKCRQLGIDNVYSWPNSILYCCFFVLLQSMVLLLSDPNVLKC